MISFIVSTFNRPRLLPVVLHALAAQTYIDFEVIICDNSDYEVRYENLAIVKRLRDDRFHWTSTRALGSCYHTAEWAAKQAEGDFLCFPSDDSYYVPVFTELMLNAAEKNNWDLVYCNMVYDGRFNGHYSLINVQPILNSIDKTGFILRRSWFEGFPGKVESGPCKSDGLLIESLINRGISHGKIPDVLLVHN